MQSYYVFNLSLPKCVGAEPRPPNRTGLSPDVKGALGSPVDNPPTTLPTVTGTELGRLLTLT